MRTSRLLIAASVAVFCQLGHSNETNSPEMTLASVICLEQSEESKLTSVGQQILADEGYQKQLASLSEASLKCLIEKKVVTAQVCTAIINNDPETRTEGPEKLNAEIKALSSKLKAAEKQCASAK